ncbi:MAG: peptide ABC transporter substrate-binding protein [Pseudomonadota bacterium]
MFTGVRRSQAASLGLRVLLFSSALLGACSGPPADSPADADTSVLRRGNLAEPQTLDPPHAEGTAAGAVLRDLFEGLVSEAADGSIVPGAASHWEISEDGLRYRFFLRDNARWSNGDALTAADFVAGFRRTVDPETASRYAPILSPIRGATEIINGTQAIDTLGVLAPDASTVEIELAQPTPYFLDLLTNPTAYPMHRASFERLGKDFVRPEHIVSNGAYRLLYWRVNDRLVAERNPAYHSPDKVAFDRVEFIPEEDATEEYNLFRTGLLDLTGTTPTALQKKLETEHADELHIAPVLTIYFYTFDLTQAPMNDVKLRQALAMAVDREALTQIVLGAGQQPAFGLVPPNIPGYPGFEYAWASTPRDVQLQTARRLYAQAGFGPDNPLQATLIYNNGETHRKIAVAIQGMLRQTLGAQIELVNQEFKVMLQNRANREVWDLMRLGWTGDYNDANTFLETFRSDHPQNTPRIADTGFDALLDAAAANLHPEDRQQQLQRAEGLLMNQYPVLPLYFTTGRRLVSQRITGFQSNPRERIYSRHLRPAERFDN